MSVKDRSYLQVIADSGKPTPPAAATATAANAPPSIDEPPTYMSEDQQKVWLELVNEHGDRLGSADRAVFAKLVNAESLYRKAQAEVQRVGALIKSPSGYPIQNPYLAIANKQHAFVVRTASELGLTPLARGRVKPTKAPRRPRGDNPFGPLRTLDD